MGGVDKKTGLTLKEELFCKLYASNEEYFGNGTRSYLKAFGKFGKNGKEKTLNSIGSMAFALLQENKILKKIRELQDIYMNDIVADKELSFVILQKNELNPKVKAITEYNKLRGRHSSLKFEFIDNHPKLSDEEIIKKIKEELEKDEKKTIKT